MFKTLVSTRPYEPTVDEYPRSWCGKDSSCMFILFPLFEAIYSAYRFCGWHSMKLSPMGSKFQSCWIAIFPVGFGPGWTRWKYLRFLNGWTSNEMTPYHSTICCNIIPTSTQIHQLLQIFANRFVENCFPKSKEHISASSFPSVSAPRRLVGDEAENTRKTPGVSL